MDSSSTARFCVFENAVMDFSLMTDVARPQRSTGSRKWGPGFLSAHCDQAHSSINYFEVGTLNQSVVILPSLLPTPTYVSLLVR